MTNYVMVLVIGLVAFAVGAGLIKLNHYYAVRRSNALAKFVTTDVEKMLEDYTDHMLEKTVKMTKEIYSEAMNGFEKGED